MNKVVLLGRLTADPEIRSTADGMTVARYTIAVDRPAARQEAKTDFIPCVAFAKRAEFAEKHLHKGERIALEGRLQTDTYTDHEGKKRTSYTVVVDNHYFCEGKKPAEQKQDTAWANIPDGDAGLPWG